MALGYQDSISKCLYWNTEAVKAIPASTYQIKGSMIGYNEV